MSGTNTNTNPGWVDGMALSALMLNNTFSGKVDQQNGYSVNQSLVTPTINGGSINNVTIAYSTLQGNINSTGYLTVGGPINISNQTTVSGPSAGSVIWSMPFQGAAYKKFIAYLSGYENSSNSPQIINFPTIFTQIPFISVNTTILMLNVTTMYLSILSPGNTEAYNGWIVIEGF